MTDAIESILHEDHRFPPPETGFKITAHEYAQLQAEAAADPEAFWARLAAQELHWFEPWQQVLDWQGPDVRWFVGGKLNISYNCLDRHVLGGRADKTALIWEGEPGDVRRYTYAELHAEVCRMANALKSLGVAKGDRVGIHMPMIPEAMMAMLACARIGAVHSVVFGGFSAEALRDRLLDAQARLVITADGGWRKDAIVPLKAQVDKALADQAVPSVAAVLVVERTQQGVTLQPDRDYWWHELREQSSPDCPPEPMDSEDMLFILYTSGTTGKPKGIVHTTGGYNLYSHMTCQWVFDLRDDDIFWCTADIGWITGHSYVVYGPLSNGATVFMYEGATRASNPGCTWDSIQNHQITIFYTAPTAIRAWMRLGDDLPLSRDLSSLRLLGTVGEPINPSVWLWYRCVIGRDRCPIVDTWWQTETGGIMVSALPGAVTTKPGSACLPLPGIALNIVSREGEPEPTDVGGFLVIEKPWPGMLRTIYGDRDRYQRTYYDPIPGVYFAGDGARRDAEGYLWVMGRVDDVINVSGHRLGTMEIESALVSHPAVTEAAVVGRPDDLTGEAIVAFVTTASEQTASPELVAALKAHVVNEIGAIARPQVIHFTDSLPKTRSGKIMRRLLRGLAAGQGISGDTSTLEDREGLEKLRLD